MRTYTLYALLSETAIFTFTLYTLHNFPYTFLELIKCLIIQLTRCIFLALPFVIVFDVRYSSNSIF